MRSKLLLAAGLIAAAGLAAACSSGAGNTNQANSANANASMPVAQTGDNPTVAPGNAPTGTDPTKDAKPAPNVHPGPDNSDVEVVMNDNGDVVETRTFKDNKNVSKVVVVTSAKDGKMTKTVTVYDAKGKPRTVPESKAESIMQQTGDDVARAAGIAVQKTSDVAGETRDAAGKVVDGTVDATKKTAGKAADVGKQTVDKTKQGVDKLKGKLP